MSNGDTGYWTGSLVYAPSWSSSPYTVNFGQTDYSFNGTGPSTGYSGTLASYNPIDSWELNGNANDDSVPPMNGTAFNVTFGNANTAIAGQTSASFNGTNSYVLTPVNPSGYTKFTVSAWVNLNGVSEVASPRIIGNSNGGINGFELGLTVTTFAPFWRIGNGSTSSTIIGAPMPSAGWVHLVGTWDGNTTALYVNGALALTGTLAGGTLAGGPNNVYIGQNPGIGGDFFGGLLQGVAMLPTALSPSQVIQLYNSATIIQSSGVGGVDWLWMSMQGWDSPPVSGSVVQRASDHGGYPTEQYFAPRTMTLTVHASAPTQAARDQARAELQAAIPVNDLALLTYNEPIPKQALVRRSGQVVETYADLTDVEFACVLVAPDPRKYTQTVKSLQTVSPPTRSGISIPTNFATSPAPYSVGSHSTTATTCTFTVTTAVPVGGGVVLSMVCPNATAQTVTAADSQGNAYAIIAQAAQASAPAESLFTLAAPILNPLSTSDTITVTTTNSQLMTTEGIAFPAYAGIDTINQVIGNNATPALPNTPPSTANSYNLVFFSNNATKTATVPADGRGWHQFSNVTSGSLSLDAFSVSNVSTAAMVCSSTYGATAPWSATFIVVDTSAPTVPNLAFTELGFTNPAASTTWGITAGSSIPLGVAAMVQVAGGNSSVGSLTVSDARGNVYSLISNVANAASGATMFEAVYGCITTFPVSISDVVTISGATSANYMSTWYWGNVNPYTGISASNFGTGTTASLSVTGVSGDVAVGLAGSLGAATSASGWTNISTNFGNGFNNSVFYQLVSGSSSFSSTVNSPWLALVNSFNLPPLPTFPGQTPGGSLAVTNSGNFETRPVITITGPIVGPSLTLDGTKTISFSQITLASGDKLVISTDPKTSMLNGSYRPSDIGSAWWVLHPGTHTVQLSGTTTGGASMQIVYQDAWI